MTNGHSEDSLMEEQAHHETGEESIEGGRCTYFFLHDGLHRLLTGVM
jgi:hypothetical protein